MAFVLRIIPKPKQESLPRFRRCFCFTANLLRDKRPRVLPVCHQVLGEHNAQYFTPHPHLTREEMEEPPAPVSNEVKDLLQLRRPSYDDTKWVPPKLKGWQFRHRRKELIAAGHQFPEFPMRDRMLDIMPKVKSHVIAKEIRLKNIDENMKMMPQWIQEYKEKKRQEKLKKDEQKRKHKIDLIHIEKLGIHPKDPRAKQMLEDKTKLEETGKKKKKFANIKKKNIAVDES